MSISGRIRWYLESQHIDYDVVSHAHTASVIESAHAVNVPGGLVAKCVLFEDERGYLMAIVPASCRVDLERLEQITGRHMELATEQEISDIFVGCEPGAIPPIGGVFNVPTVIDQSLLRIPEVYFEEGDHSGLVHLSGRSFRAFGWKASYEHLGRPEYRGRPH